MISCWLGLAIPVDDDFLLAGIGYPRLNGHADGIEAYHLADGIGHGLAVYRSGDAEVLQFIV